MAEWKQAAKEAVAIHGHTLSRGTSLRGASQRRDVRSPAQHEPSGRASALGTDRLLVSDNFHTTLGIARKVDPSPLTRR